MKSNLTRRSAVVHVSLVAASDETAVPRGSGANLLVLDCAYTHEEIRSRGLEHVVTQLDLDGLFDHVWQVHPLVGANAASGRELGRSRSFRLSSRHTLIEAPLGRFRWLRRLPALNLLAAQCSLFAQLSRLARRQGIDVVAAADPFFLGLWGLGFSFIHRMPLVVKVNANYDAMYEADDSLAYPRLIRWRWLQDLVVRTILPRADLVTVGSDDNWRYVKDHGAPASRIAMVPSGDMIAEAHLEPPSDRASVSEELDLVDRPFMVFVGRLEPYKHPDAPIAALERIRPSVPGIALVIVGEGSMGVDLQRQARQLGVSQDVRFVGTRDQRWIARALSSAAVVVCPYSGLVLIEAALSGTPVVGYDVEWQGELITPGETGILVPFRDTDALARSIEELLQDPSRGRALGEAARRRTLEDMSPAEAVSVKRSIYARLCHGQRRAVRRR